MMNTSQGTPSGDITLSTMIDAVAKEKGIDRKVLVETVEQAILKAAQNAFGEDRELEANSKRSSPRRPARSTCSCT
jgi:transcription termination/antitermination protein NusA